jgi:heptosyltransferase-2
MGDRPCFANKQYGVFCGNCSYFEEDKDIGVFPEIPHFAQSAKTTGHKKIIIIKLDAAGDVLRTTSLLPAIKKKFGDSSITWITKKKSFNILSSNKLIDEIHFDIGHLENIYAEKFDIAINLDTGKESCSIMSKINAEELYGFTLVNGKPYPFNSLANQWYLMGVDDNVKKKNNKTYYRIIHEICGLTYENSKPQLEITETGRINAAFIREKQGLQNYGEFILVNLGGGNRWQYKKWTKEGYAGLINKLSAKKPNSAIGAVAGEEDRDFYHDAVKSIDKRDNVFLFGCENSIEDFIGMIYLADKVFTSDSLAFHIATALDKYTIVFTGPTSYTELDVFGNGKIIYSSKVDCLVCYLNRCDKKVTCMNTLSPDDVISYLL